MEECVKARCSAAVPLPLSVLLRRRPAPGYFEMCLSTLHSQLSSRVTASLFVAGAGYKQAELETASF